ncbi:penicillin-binding transpeptidase domain-containing protein [Kitasatospora sp. NPDC094015]|uniref:penicillin-binding transpeptidase domain-containing protein n=1 Tax=Kitasatospora sp. NPDC094015 TaxID=3155205 RepID=UPI003326D233
MNKGAKIGISTVAAAMLAVAGYGAYSFATGGSEPDPAKPRTVVAEPPGQEQAAAGAKAFLEAWAKGDVAAAAALTDSPEAATATLTAFRQKVNPSAITLTPGGPAPAPTAPAAGASGSPSPTPGSATAGSTAAAAPAHQVPLSFKAKVEFAQTGTPWSYDGVLGMVKMSDGKAAVHWAPTVIHPKLGAGESISVKPVTAPASSVVDRKGKALNSPSITPLLGQIKAPVPDGSAEAGTAVVISDDAGKAKPETVFTLVEPKPAPPLKLTIDADLQKAAEAAVQEASKGGTLPASVVAVEPSTGNVLAFANAPSTGQNRAFLSSLAPGSTMKIITAAALMEAGVTPDTPVACPDSATIGGQVFKNDFPEPHPDYKFRQDFAQSCNTAFINEGSARLKNDTLPAIAKDAFGLGLVWQTGLTAFDTVVPAPKGANEMVAEFIGQGRIQTSPLAMASVSATVQSGTFRQPILVAGTPQAPAKRQLSGDVLTGLRTVMNETVRTGTASKLMSQMANGSGAKTGTAEVGNQTSANSWFTAFRGNLAVAALVENGGHGADAAGPAAVKLLQIGNG